MYAPYGPFFAIIPEILPRNVAGGAMALINSMGALGSFAGSYVVGYLKWGNWRIWSIVYFYGWIVTPCIIFNNYCSKRGK